MAGERGRRDRARQLPNRCIPESRMEPRMARRRGVRAPPPTNRPHRAPPYKGVRGGVRGRRGQPRAPGAGVAAMRWGGVVR
jgi:hypothetical protein